MTVPAARAVLESMNPSVSVKANVNELAARGATWSARLAALNKIIVALLQHAPSALRSTICLPLLDTESHRALLAALVQRAEQLAAGIYWGKNGVACRLLLGAPGIGETNLMQAIACACSLAFPDVIVLYVSCADLGQNSAFQKMTLHDLMIATARAHGVDVDESKGAFVLTEALQNAGKADAPEKADPLNMADVLEKARKGGKRMLIIVDETVSRGRKPARSAAACHAHAVALARIG